MFIKFGSDQRGMAHRNKRDVNMHAYNGQYSRGGSTRNEKVTVKTNGPYSYPSFSNPGFQSHGRRRFFELVDCRH
jgi:hypothetical protein